MTGEKSNPNNRRYHSELRASQAAQTRRRILDAAATRFASAGYAGTALADIARDAGVSIETVKLGGPKRSLLLAAFEQSFAGSEGLDSLADHDPVAHITAAADNKTYLAGIVRFVAASNSRSSRLWSALIAAAAADDALGVALAELQARRHADTLILVDELRRRGLLRGEAPRGRCADAVSFLLSPEGYNQLVHGAGWSREEYEAWLRRSIPLLAGPAAAGD
ncbi:TetR/AcrR family transcriptional regulator [Mycetocola spongiae]|uniref:TetR/AcrR family transcriptional regulator n=1 Tax=Mycetocola spongiae TaxID=2859226 RepID=UPI001CF5B816|nr:TetR family transcriptional regulator [Mycetocola spongiae]UCR90166.1 TetR family transcriptional regulator [Mycetocola spongiae]